MWQFYVLTLFVAESYHTLSHWLVLFGWKMLPRRDLVAVRYYFLLDAMCAALAYGLHKSEIMLPFLILQQWQHIFYFSTWDVSRAARRVISWSSLDWDRGRWNQIDLVLGTAFDMSIHAANMLIIGSGLSTTQILPSFVIVAVLYVIVFSNPKLAWASYKANNMPSWVSRRIKPLSQDQVQEVELFDRMLG